MSVGTTLEVLFDDFFSHVRSARRVSDSDIERRAYLERLGFGHHRPAIYGSNPFCQICLRSGVVHETHNITTGSTTTMYPSACPYSEV